MIHEVDESLRNLLLGELKRVPKSGIEDASQITFTPPSVVEAEKNAKPRINLYLHDVRENRKLRENLHSVTRQRDSETIVRRQAPLILDLAYVVSIHAGDDASVEHRILVEVLGILARNAAIPTKYLTEELAADPDQSVQILVAQADHPAQQDPASLWVALGGKLRPTLGLVVTGNFNPYETRTSRIVREAILGIGQGVPPHGPKRPLDIKSTRVAAAGIVLDPGGNELRNASVEVKGRNVSAQTNEKGFFYFLDLPAGRATLVFRAPGMRTQEIVTNVPPVGRPDQLEPIVVNLVSMDDAEKLADGKERTLAAWSASGFVEVERAVTISVSGRLAYPDGRPAAYVPVRAGERSTTTDGDGFYSFINLRETPKEIVAEVPGRDPEPIAAGKAVNVLGELDKADKKKK